MSIRSRSGRGRAAPTAHLWLAALLCVGFHAVGRAQEAPPATSAARTTAQAGERPELSDPREAGLDAEAAAVASQLRCPVCRNQSVLESNADLSREMQALVRERLAAGETPDEVKAYFVSRYGEWILLKPQARGVNLLVYLLPFLALASGAIVVRRLLRRWAKASGDASDPLPGARKGIAADVAALAEEDERWLKDALREG